MQLAAAFVVSRSGKGQDLCYSILCDFIFICDLFKLKFVQYLIVVLLAKNETLNSSIT